MNLDIFSQIEFGDGHGVRAFMLAHSLIHDEEAVAIAAQFGVSQSTFAMRNGSAEDAWVARMAERGEKGQIPFALQDWLEWHADIHNQTYQIIGGNAGVQAPDLSQVDFGNAEQFYDWMQSHQQMHDFEQQSLGLT